MCIRDSFIASSNKKLCRRKRADGHGKRVAWNTVQYLSLIHIYSGYNEQGAAFAACGYAQAKEECACAYATSGPGAINLLSGVADAYYDSLPVIFLTGQLNTYEYSGIKGLRQQGFQETDMVAMAKPITKYAVQIRKPEDIVEELNKAYHIATTGRRGPVLIDLPMNIQRSEVENPVYDMTFEDKHTDAAAAPVSYTHLDVYKRQDQIYCSAQYPVRIMGRNQTGIYHIPVIIKNRGIFPVLCCGVSLEAVSYTLLSGCWSRSKRKDSTGTE